MQQVCGVCECIEGVQESQRVRERRTSSPKARYHINISYKTHLDQLLGKAHATRRCQRLTESLPASERNISHFASRFRPARSSMCVKHTFVKSSAVTEETFQAISFSFKFVEKICFSLFIRGKRVVGKRECSRGGVWRTTAISLSYIFLLIKLR